MGCAAKREVSDSIARCSKEPPTRISGGPAPSLSNAMVVPSFEITFSIPNIFYGSFPNWIWPDKDHYMPGKIPVKECFSFPEIYEGSWKKLRDTFISRVCDSRKEAGK